MEKFESNKNYESELLDSVEKNSKKDLNDLETEVTNESVDFNTPEEAKTAILDKMWSDYVFAQKTEIHRNIAKDASVEFVDNWGGSYEFDVKYRMKKHAVGVAGVGEGNMENIRLEYDAKENKFWFLDNRRSQQNRIWRQADWEELSEKDALDELNEIYYVVNQIKWEWRVSGRHNNGGRNNRRR